VNTPIEAPIPGPLHSSGNTSIPAPTVLEVTNIEVYNTGKTKSSREDLDGILAVEEKSPTEYVLASKVDILEVTLDDDSIKLCEGRIFSEDKFLECLSREKASH
jgi:hypothetical protein